MRDRRVKFKVSNPPKLLTGKRRVINSIPKSTVYNSRTTDGSYIFIEPNGKAKERTRFAPLSQTNCSKMKILIWMCRSCLKERQKSKLLVMQVRVGGCK